MFKFVLLLVTLSGLRAVPIRAPRGSPKTSSSYRLPDGFQQGTEPSNIFEPVPEGFRQGTEPSRRFLVDLNTGLVKEHISEMDRRVDIIRPSFGNGFGEMKRNHRLITDDVPVDVPVQKTGDGWLRVQEPSAPHLPDGFRQGTEPSVSIVDGFRQGTQPLSSIPDGFRQGTEPSMSIPEGFRQGTQTSVSIPDGFRQGTEPSMSIPEGFRQGTQTSVSIPEGFRQGTEPSMSIPEGFRQATQSSVSIPDGFRQGTEPSMSIPEGFRQGTQTSVAIPEGFRQGTEPSTSRLQIQPVACKGEVINGNCYEFNPTLLAFKEAQDVCRELAPNAELASVTSGDLHSRLVSLVTDGGKSSPSLTWLGGRVKNQQGYWVDGSDWTYSDWMPGQPNIHTDKPVCLQMFKMDESWWSAADCELKRASICSYSIAA